MRMFDFLPNFEELTKSEKRVLAYLIEHTELIPYMTIQQLATSTYVSKTVIINLAQKLGFSGFKELKFYLNNKLKEQSVPVQNTSLSVKKELETSVLKTFTLISEEDVNHCAELLLKSKNIFIMARGTSKPVGYYLEHLLFSLGLHCFFINDYNHSESFTRLVGPDDVVVLFSLSGNTKKILETAQTVHLKQAKVIGVTSFQSNQLSQYADLNLYAYTEEWDTKKDDSISRVGFFLIVDLLIGTLRRNITDRIKE